MTKPRLSSQRELYGLLGRTPRRSAILRRWNAYFDSQGLDAFLDHYSTTPEQLPERLSEMFHFDRRLYLLVPPLCEAVVPLVDALSQQACDRGEVNFVVNRGGILEGRYVDIPFEAVEILLQEAEKSTT